ncbi:MAG: hypothetical protein LRY46_00200 [Candidatus Pacebacteria bacterium]|nr:hypothetical protein [Candidatus Paceibacterota bacterium]MCD8508010.1 hypothetical protein [Candidatus Paceibacterota bacterium]
MHHQEPPSSPIVLAPRTIIMALIILGSALLLWQVKSTILVILLAIVIASFVDGGVRMFQRIHVPRYLAVIIIYLSGVLLLGFFLYAFIPVLLDELLALLQLLPEDAPFAEFLASLGDSGLREALTQLTSNPDMNPFEVIKMIRSEISAFNIIEGLGVFFGGMVNVVLVVVISFTSL